MGGEKKLFKDAELLWLGSPPRGRGKVHLGHKRTQELGITPAWAGKSPGVLNSGVDLGDHPRVGGEKRPNPKFPALALGSPPRGRGKVGFYMSYYPAPRITPAWAGKRCYPEQSWSMRRDHPRVGGEKQPLFFVGSGVLGSPPRGRGKAPGFLLSFFCTRITPAWAGKSFT